MASSTANLDSSTETKNATRASSDSGLLCGVASAPLSDVGRKAGAMDDGEGELAVCVAAGVPLPVVHETANAIAGRRQSSRLARVRPAGPAGWRSGRFHLKLFMPAHPALVCLWSA
jgi:hypothetical protein